jgi:hypothetical protein
MCKGSFGHPSRLRKASTNVQIKLSSYRSDHSCVLTVPSLSNMLTAAPAAQEPASTNYSPSQAGFIANLTGLAAFVSELRAVRTSLVNEFRHVDAALSVLGKLDGGSSHANARRTLSASARKRISLAQKARWAKKNKLWENFATTRPRLLAVGASHPTHRAVPQRIPYPIFLGVSQLHF